MQKRNPLPTHTKSKTSVLDKNQEDLLKRLERLKISDPKDRRPTLRAPSKFVDRRQHELTASLSRVENWKCLSNVNDPVTIISRFKKCEVSAVKFIQNVSTFEECRVVFDSLGALLNSSYEYSTLSVVKLILTVDFMNKLTRIFGDCSVWVKIGLDQFLSVYENVQKCCLLVLKSPEHFKGEDFTAAFDAFLVSIVKSLETLKSTLAILGDGIPDNLSSLLTDFGLLKNAEIGGDLPGDDGTICFYPTDLFTQNKAIEPNISIGSYVSSKHYIHTQISLLKEDFESRLRDGVALYLRDPTAKNHDVWIYKNVVISLGMVNKKEHLHVIKLQDGFLDKIDWGKSNRFLHGSMVLIASENLKVFHVAIIRDRGNVENKRSKAGYYVCVEFLVAPPKYDQANRYVMIEPKTFFEPYHKVMISMASFSDSGLPMERYLVDVDTSPRLPKYITQSTVYTIDSTTVCLTSAASWPGAGAMNVNESQKIAVINALSNELVLIQGPPGTGKTYLAYKLITYLIANKKFETPILVVCYKNHSLDQVLEGLLDRGVRLLRIGGQSKSERLKHANLSKIRTVSGRKIFREIKDNEQSSGDVSREMHQLWNVINLVKTKRGIVHLKLLKDYNVISDKITQFFENHCDLALEKWLVDFMSYDDDDLPPYPTNEQINEANRLKFSPSIVYSLSLDEIVKHVETLRIRHDNIEATSHTKPLNRKQRRIMLGCIVEIEEHLCLLSMLQSRLDTYRTVEADESTVQSILSAPNLGELSLEDRWKVYNFWESQLLANINKTLERMMNERFILNEAHVELKRIFNYHQIQDYRPDVVGITTSGAAAHHRLLESVGPAVVIVEEAAEVLESHIVASLSKSCKHLILIGDHKQLKPSTASHVLATKYRMNVSLFERMMLNSARCDTINVQHRMRPEIAALISPSIYPDLKNHPSVTLYPNVAGVSKNLWFFHHTAPEEMATDSESRFNRFEGDFALALCVYLLKQDTYRKNPKITILTTYKEQERYITKGWKRLELKSPDVRITAVDNYQGEENDVIILSLVRNNSRGDIGFLSIENRVCVALSRAKHGLYILGNATCLLKNESSIWIKIFDELESQDAFGTEIPLKCSTHGTVTRVKKAEDIFALELGGCLEKCLMPFDCGHLCTRQCHGYDVEHSSNFFCQSPCRKKCPEGHPCRALCSEDCPPCRVLVPKELPCSHVADVRCSVEPKNDHCRKKITFTFEDCGHQRLIACRERFQVKCITTCNDDLPCGHKCPQICHENSDRSHENYKCVKKCTKPNATCPLQHECTRLCSEDCGSCLFPVTVTLECGHSATKACSKDVKRVKCKEPCTRILSTCPHNCTNLCSMPCGPCSTQVVYKLSCGHESSKLCGSEEQDRVCTEKCARIKDCGHKCSGLCSYVCNEIKCVHEVPVTMLCGHTTRVKCHKSKVSSDSMLALCKKPCREKLPCGHECQGTCGSCLQGRVHRGCTKPCNSRLRCSHLCKAPCGTLYHSCDQKACDSACWGPSSGNEDGNVRRERNCSYQKQAFNRLNGLLWKYARKDLTCEKEDERPERATLARFSSKISVSVSKFRMKRNNSLQTLMSHMFLVEFCIVAKSILEKINEKPHLSYIAEFLDNLIESFKNRDIHHLSFAEIDQVMTQITFLKYCVVLDTKQTKTVFEMWNDLNSSPMNLFSKLRKALFVMTDKHVAPIIHHANSS